MRLALNNANGLIKLKPPAAVIPTGGAPMRDLALPSSCRGVYIAGSRQLADADDYPEFNDAARMTTSIRAYERLGAHAAADGAPGVDFAVRAPLARSVSVVCDVNGWSGERDPMTLDEGVWRCRVPDVGYGEVYKYRITGRDGSVVDKCDPYAFASEIRPATASRVWDLDRYRWGDDEWMAARAERHGLDQPLSVYEVHAGSWRRHCPDGAMWSYAELAATLIPYVKEMGFTHVELLPISEHPFDASWGYQVGNYFSPTSRFGPPEAFMAFVDECHRQEVGVILDWVPAHFPKDEHALARFDGSHLYEYEDPRLGEHRSWGTCVFDFGSPVVREFLLSNAIFWCDRYHVDGLRVDAVASMIYLDYGRDDGEWKPNRRGDNINLEAVELLRDFNAVVHEQFPGLLTFAEESTSFPRVTTPVADDGLGFDFKWNMGWMNDTLRYLGEPPEYRRDHSHQVTFPVTYAFSERFILPFSHDEVVHTKSSLLHKAPGSMEQQFAGLRALYAYMYAYPGKKLLFMGAEFGVRDEWDHDSELDWGLLQHAPHRGLRAFVRDLNRLYRASPALHARDDDGRGFEWLHVDDAHRGIVAFMRRGPGVDDIHCIVVNFSPEAVAYELGVPVAGDYETCLDSNAADYGSPMAPPVAAPSAVSPGRDQWEYSLSVPLGPLTALVLRPVNRGGA